jgi:hypothetical protein
MPTKETYWITGTLVVAALSTGLFSGFNYIDIINIQLHDAYVEVPPLLLCFIFWTMLTFIIFLIAGLRTRFSKLLNTWILLVANSFLLILVLGLTYILYVIFAMELLSDVFREASKADQTLPLFYQSMFICGVVVIIMLMGEFFLVRQVIRIRRESRTS